MEYSHQDMLWMEPPRVMLTYTAMTVILLVSIVPVLTPGPVVLFLQTIMPFMSSKTRRHFTPLMNSRVDLLIRGADWLVYLLVLTVLTMWTDELQGFDQCAILLNMEFERVFYKNNFASGVELLNIYMICKIAIWLYLLEICADL
jgi:hypothetical protein